MEMLNRLVLSVLLPFAGCLSLYSETSVSGYTYADGELMTYGTSRAETLDVAMCIDNPALEGFKVTSVKAYVNAREGISATSLWMSSELKLEKKVNAPDIWSRPVEVEAGVYTDPANGKEYTVGVFEYMLDEPYELTGAPVYVGYSMKVDNVKGEQLKQPVLLSKTDNTDGFFFHSNKTAIHWANYSEKTGGVAVICITLENETSDSSLGIVRIIQPVYAQENEDFLAQIEVSNTGDAPVSDITYRYVPYDGADVKEAVLEFQDPIMPDLVRPSRISLKIDGVSGLGVHEMPIEIVKVNSIPNASLAKERKLGFTVVPFVPKHRPLVEEYTGLWCKFCIRGYIGMELLREMYADDQVSICFHNNDAMMVTTTYPVEIPGYPAASIDRDLVLDPYFGTYQDIDFGIRRNLENTMKKLAVADIDVLAEIEGMKVSVESTVRFIEDVSDCNYQMGYVLTCDGMSNSTWLQSNAYSGAAGLEGTYLEQAALWPSNVPGLVFNDVAVDVTGMLGIERSLPKDMNMGEAYTHSYLFNLEYNKLVTPMDNLNVVAFIIDKNTGSVINANKVALSHETGVDVVPSSPEVVSMDYYDVTGRKVSNPADGVFIRLDRLSDGRTVSTKVYR